MAAAGSGQRFASRGVRAQHAPLPLSLRRGAGGRKRKAGDALLAPDGASRKVPRGGALLASVRDSLLLAQLWLAALYQVPPRPAARSSRRAASRARCQNFTCSAQALQACAAPRSLALLSIALEQRMRRVLAPSSAQAGAARARRRSRARCPGGARPPCPPERPRKLARTMTRRRSSGLATAPRPATRRALPGARPCARRPRRQRRRCPRRAPAPLWAARLCCRGAPRPRRRACWPR